MKKLFWVLGVFFVLISILLIVIIKRGVIIRPQPLIKPTAINENFEPVARHVILRMFPDFQRAEYVIWNLDLKNSDAHMFQSQILQEYVNLFQRPAHILNEGQSIEACQKPCWIFFPFDHKSIDNSIRINWIDYDHVDDIPEACMNKKVLDSNCVKFVSLKSVERKLKNPRVRYFFLQKYLDDSFYLFVQKMKK